MEQKAQGSTEYYTCGSKEKLNTTAIKSILPNTENTSRALLCLLLLLFP